MPTAFFLNLYVSEFSAIKIVLLEHFKLYPLTRLPIIISPFRFSEIVGEKYPSLSVTKYFNLQNELIFLPFCMAAICYQCMSLITHESFSSLVVSFV